MAQLDGIDCATKLNASSAARLKSQGMQYVGRYLGNSWKSMDRTEAETILNTGLKIVSIWETNPTHVSYFSKSIYAGQFLKLPGGSASGAGNSG